MRRRAAALLVLVPVLSPLAACSSHDARQAITTTTTTSTSTSTTVPPTTTTSAVPSVPATDPAALAVQLTQAERAVRDPATPATALDGWARLQQAAYRAIAVRPALRAPVVAAAGADVRTAVAANAEAAVELRALTTPRTELPPWRVVAPAPATELRAAYHGAEAELGVPWSVLAAINFVETKFGRIRGPSTAGARGPMQFLPSTWAQYGSGGDIESTRDSVLAAARMLKRNGAPSRMADALYAYNHSAHYVTAVQDIARVLAADEAAFSGYWRWQVYYRMADGDRVLPEGWPDVPEQRLPA
jgi:membrane-bound lytic murein transglycosylase B